MPLPSCVFVTALLIARLVSAQAPSQLLEYQRLVTDQQLDKAQALLDGLLEEDVDNPWAHFQLAYLEQIQGNIDKAIAKYQNCLKLKHYPLEAACFYNLACAEAAKGRPQQALQVYRQSLLAGFHDYNMAATDPDLAAIRQLDGFHLPTEPKFEQYQTSEGQQVEFGVVLPVDFDAAKTVPCLIAFSPGDMGRSVVETGFDYWWGQQAAERGWLVVAPMASEGRWITKPNEQLMKSWMDDLRARYRIEGSKFHIAGCSGGGPSSFHVAITFPNRVHSLPGLPAYPIASDVPQLPNLKPVLIVNMCGGDDRGWVDRVRATHQVLKGLKCKSQLKVFANDGHVINGLRGGELMKILNRVRKKTGSASVE